jgi:hypothetical protein
LRLNRRGISRAFEGDQHRQDGGLLPLLFAFDFHGVKLSESPAMGKEIPGDPRSVLSAKNS